MHDTQDKKPGGHNKTVNLREGIEQPAAFQFFTIVMTDYGMHWDAPVITGVGTRAPLTAHWMR